MCFSTAQLLSEGSVAIRQVSFQVSCNLPAELHPISSLHSTSLVHHHQLTMTHAALNEEAHNIDACLADALMR